MNRITKTPLGKLNSVLIILSLVGFLFAADCFAQGGETKKSADENPLVGRWRSTEAVVEIRADGTLTINGDEFSYKIKGRSIIVSNKEGSLEFPFELSGDKLTVSVEGRLVVYTRQKGKTGAVAGDKKESADSAANPPELVGKWCYLSNLTGTNSRMSSRCFTLNADGTYEYYAETSSSGSAGSSASQESDSGRWSATETTITAYSKTQGKITFSLEKRNHPKTGDPMLIVDGDAYVTAYAKDPW